MTCKICGDFIPGVEGWFTILTEKGCDKYICYTCFFWAKVNLRLP